MRLGTYLFPWTPDRFTIPQADRIHAAEKTWSSAVLFSWGADIIGKRIVMEWEFTSVAQYDEMRAILEADAGVEWDPNRPGYGGMAYNVEVLAVDGEYFEVADKEQPYRRNVRVELMIMSEAGYGVGS